MVASDRKGSKDPTIEITDEPGMAERFQRGLRNLINTPPKPRKPKARQGPKERVHKGEKQVCPKCKSPYWDTPRQKTSPSLTETVR